MYHTDLARTYANWFDYLSRQENASVGERLALLEIGLRHDPKNLAILNRLLTVTGMQKSPQASTREAASTLGLAAAGGPLEILTSRVAVREAEAEAGVAILRRLLAQGQVTSQVHFALAVAAQQRDDVKEGRYHLERAYQLDPDLPGVANNLAWLLLHTSPDELPKALELINLAIDKAPRDPNFRDTRGQILAKMGRHQEAIIDLEAALPFSGNSAALHRTMADVYTHLGLPKLAAEHERLAPAKTPKKDASPRR
jgi:Flp pilus assembly protein TadD